MGYVLGRDWPRLHGALSLIHMGFAVQTACLRIGRGPNGAERLQERPKKDNPWLKLRLPDGHKDLVQSLIHSHFAKQKSGGVHFDLLRNKGMPSVPYPSTCPFSVVAKSWGQGME